MPLLTVKAIDALKPKAKPYRVRLDRGLVLRIAPDGARTLLVRYTVKGCEKERTYTLAQEYGEGHGQIRLAAACSEAQRIRMLAREGVDWPAQEESRLKAEREAAARERSEQDDQQTFGEALRQYVNEKRRAKDGLPLKERTKADYRAMIEQGRLSSKGKRFADGTLFSMANKRLSEIAASDIRDVYEAVLKRSKRQATYSMQVVRAVLRWHGVTILNNPLGRETAGRDRIVIALSRGNPAPIPPEKLGAWWRAATDISREAADYYRFLLLTGCRGVEILGSKRYGYEPLKVGDVDLLAGRILLRDTKNRTDHELFLSNQALEIAGVYCKSRPAEAPLFVIVDGRKTLAAINAAVGTTVTGKGLRATFASIAEELVSGALLKRMMNHMANGDVTLGHYVGKGEAQLRAGWQTVADFVDTAAAAAIPAGELPARVLRT